MALKNHIRKVGQYATPQELIDIEKRRSKLGKRVADHQKRAAALLCLNDDELVDERFDNTYDDIELEDDDRDDSQANPLGNAVEGGRDIECFLISLPSSIGPEACRDRGITSLINMEVQLRIGQCNDSLQAVRLAIAKKSFLYGTKVRKAKGKKHKTRAYAAVQTADAGLRTNAQIYRAVRQKLVVLEAGSDVLQKYQLLQQSHLKSNTTLLDPRITGQRHHQLPWFWSLDVAGDISTHGEMRESECIVMS